MGATPAKVARLARHAARGPLPGAPVHRRPHLTFEARQGIVTARDGDHVAWQCEAPSATAARAIASTLRDLQKRRGTIMDPRN